MVLSVNHTYSAVWHRREFAAVLAVHVVAVPVPLLAIAVTALFTPGN